MKNAEVENFHYSSVLVGRTGSSKNGCRHFKLILCCFWAISNPHTKFHPNRKINAEVENFNYWSVLVGRAGRSKNGRRHFKLILQKCPNYKMWWVRNRWHPPLQPKPLDRIGSNFLWKPLRRILSGASGGFLNFILEAKIMRFL